MLYEGGVAKLFPFDEHGKCECMLKVYKKWKVFSKYSCCVLK